MFKHLLLEPKHICLQKKKAKSHQKHFTWTTQDKLIVVSHIREFVYNYHVKGKTFVENWDEGWKWQISPEAPKELRSSMKGHWGGKLLNTKYDTIKETLEAAYQKVEPVAKQFDVTVDKRLKKASKSRFTVKADNDYFQNNFGGHINGSSGQWKFVPFNGSSVLNSPFFTQLRKREFQNKTQIFKEIQIHINNNLPSLYYEAMNAYQAEYQNMKDIKKMLGVSVDLNDLPVNPKDYNTAHFWFLCYLKPCNLEELFPL